METKKKENRISILGEFADRNFEKEFIDNYLGRTKRYFRPIILALGILYMLFIIPDYFVIKNHEILKAVLANRAIFLLSIIVLFIASKKVKNYTKLAYWITIYEIFAAISFLVILGQYDSANYLIQSFGVMVIILGIFLLPNKWSNTVIASLLTSISFFVLSLYYIKGIKPSEYYAGLTYIIIVLVLSSISSYLSNYYNRKQYAYSRELLILSVTDPLTGIYNRLKFDEELELWISYAKRYGTPLSVVIFDFDNFKSINDTYGHLIGDNVLVDTINNIKNSIRNIDVLARWGGEEFALLLPNTDLQHAAILAERLRLQVAGNVFENVGNITCSFGIAAFNEQDTAVTMISRADRFLYKAKSAGKNRLAY